MSGTQAPAGTNAPAGTSTSQNANTSDASTGATTAKPADTSKSETAKSAETKPASRSQDDKDNMDSQDTPTPKSPSFGERALKAAQDGQKAAAVGQTRDLGREPYDAQERRVAAFLERIGQEAGNDPIGLLMGAYAQLSTTRE